MGDPELSSLPCHSTPCTLVVGVLAMDYRNQQKGLALLDATERYQVVPSIAASSAPHAQPRRQNAGMIFQHALGMRRTGLA